jgi:hypothetical protein
MLKIINLMDADICQAEQDHDTLIDSMVDRCIRVSTGRFDQGIGF